MRGSAVVDVFSRQAFPALVRHLADERGIVNRGALKDPEAVIVELAEYAAPVILLAVVFVLASTRPAR